MGIESADAVCIGMVAGTITTEIADADPRELRQATELVAAAPDRVVEHLRLAAQFSRRMRGDPGGGWGRVHG